MAAIPVLHFAGQSDYDVPLPYHPPERYPELEFLGGATEPRNQIYAGVRRVLWAAGYDGERFGSREWSPLSDLVAPGGTVVLKPNFVRHFNETHGESVEAVVTQPAVLRPLIDYAWKAVGPRGCVVVADAPQYDCDIEILLRKLRLAEFLGWYREIDREVPWYDLRVEFGRHDYGVQVEKTPLAGDPRGYLAVDLGAASEFHHVPAAQLRLLRGADYDEEVTIEHHSGGRNEYLVSKTVLDADLVINVPKIKTHKKAGVTLSMKNLIGINGDKNWLPHYRAGFASGGGDEFPKPDAYARMRALGGEWARRMLKRGIGAPVLRRLRAAEEASGLGRRTRSGNWWGNDTIWRTCLDLNKIFYHADRSGRLGATQRRVLNVYDGIIAGEGQGPMGPDPRRLGLLAACEDGGCADVVLTWIMGFDWRKIPLLRRAVEDLEGGVRITSFRGDPSDLRVRWIDDAGDRTIRFSEIDTNLGFAAHSGWRGRIEREPPAAPRRAG